MNPNPSIPPPPPFQAEPPSTWWNRNKAWAIPVGCIGLVVILGCCGLLGAGLFGLGKAGQYVQEQAGAMEAIRLESVRVIENSSAIKEAVGEPVTVGGFAAPNYQYRNGAVDYRFQLPVTGPKGEVVVNGQATSKGSGSPLQLRSLDYDDGERTIDLVGSQAEPGDSPDEP